MSKIGVKPIPIGENCEVVVSNNTVEISGGLGTMVIKIPNNINVKKKDSSILITVNAYTRDSKALFGTTRSLIFNAVSGVNKLFERKLEIVGTGYRVKLDGENLVFEVGYSHPVIFKKVEGITFAVEGSNKVKIMGIDKQRVGQIAYKIKTIKKPDPYKGKGIRFEGEKIKLKPGKKAKTAGPAK